MPDSFDLLTEVAPAPTEPRRRKKRLPEYSRKGVSGVPWDGFADSLELVLDPSFGEWAVLYATFRKQLYPVVVRPEHASEYANVPLHLVMSLQGEFYVRGSFPREGKKKKVRRYLHQEICGVPDNCPLDVEVHHKTRMTLDNRFDKSNQTGNLEVVVKRLNNLLRGDVGVGTSKYVGVCYQRGHFSQRKSAWSARRKPYRAECRFGRERYFLGYFMTEVEAAKVYDAKVLELLKSQKGFVGGILPLDQVNRLINFKKDDEWLKSYFGITKSKASSQAKQKKSPKSAPEDDIPF